MILTYSTTLVQRPSRRGGRSHGRTVRIASVDLSSSIPVTGAEISISDEVREYIEGGGQLGPVRVFKEADDGTTSWSDTAIVLTGPVESRVDELRAALAQHVVGEVAEQLEVLLTDDDPAAAYNARCVSVETIVVEQAALAAKDEQPPLLAPLRSLDAPVTASLTEARLAEITEARLLCSNWTQRAREKFATAVSIFAEPEPSQDILQSAAELGSEKGEEEEEEEEEAEEKEPEEPGVFSVRTGARTKRPDGQTTPAVELQVRVLMGDKQHIATHRGRPLTLVPPDSTRPVVVITDLKAQFPVDVDALRPFEMDIKEKSDGLRPAEYTDIYIAETFQKRLNDIHNKVLAGVPQGPDRSMENHPIDLVVLMRFHDDEAMLWFGQFLMYRLSLRERTVRPLIHTVVMLTWRPRADDSRPPIGTFVHSITKDPQIRIIEIDE